MPPVTPLRTVRLALVAGAVLALSIVATCAAPRREAPEPERAAPPARSAVVTATAYTSHPEQTQGDPFETASGETLRPGMRVLAVSPDLLEAGLDFGTRVRIEGQDGEWTVRDRLPDGRRQAIDLY